MQEYNKIQTFLPCFRVITLEIGARIAQWVWRLVTGWTVRGSNPGGGLDFPHTGAHTASYTMGTGYFPVAKRPGRDVDHPPPSSADVERRVELYIYSPSELSWPVLGRNLPLPLSFTHEITFLHHRSSIGLNLLYNKVTHVDNNAPNMQYICF